MKSGNRFIAPYEEKQEDNNEVVWNPILKGIGANSRSHDQQNDDEDVESDNPILRSLSNISSKIKSVDGIDEMANLAGQILPGIAAPIATSTILIAATPFVWLGVIGMKEEYEEAKDEFEKIIGRTSNIEDKFVDLIDFTRTYQRTLKDKFNVDLDELNLENISRNAELESLDRGEEYIRFVENIVDHLSLNNKKIIGELGKKYGWTGFVGMSGMFAGMLPASASAVLEVINEIQSSAILLSTSMALQLTAGACFIPGQAFMGVYAYNRKKQGLISQDILLSVKDTFKAGSKDMLADDMRDNVEQFIDKLITYNNKHSIEYGDLTMAGQAFMIAGSACSMTGVGLLAAGPLFGVGAPLTIYGAIQRIYYDGAEEGFKGENEDVEFLEEYVKNTLRDINPVTICVNNIDNNAGKFSQLGEILEDVTDKLAEVKLSSLLFHLINDIKYRNKEDKVDVLEGFFTPIKSSGLELKIKNSQIEDIVVRKVKDLVSNDRNDIDSLLKKGNEGLKSRINKNLGVNNTESMSNKEVQILLKDAKKTLKFLRFNVIDTVVKVSQMVVVDNELTKNDQIPNRIISPSDISLNLAGNIRQTSL